MNILKLLVSTVLFFLSLFSINAQAELPGGYYIDHGYTYFSVESRSEPIDGKRVDRGFKLSGAIRIFGDAPKRSSIKLVLKKDGEVVAERRTKTAVLSAGHPKLGTLVSSTSGGDKEPHMLSGQGFAGELDPVITGVGEYEVDVVYIDGATNEEHLAHTYTLNIGKVDKLDESRNELFVRPPTYFVSRHQETLTTIMSSWMYYNGDNAAGRMVLLWNASPAETGNRPHAVNAGYLSCTVDGDPITLGNNPEVNNTDGTITKTSHDNWRYTFAQHSDRNSLEYRKGTDYRENLIFNTFYTVLPFDDMTDSFDATYGDNQLATHTSFAQYPGHWECQWLDNGTLIRTFAWDVEKDGALVPHPEQAKGLTLNPSAILVETILPEKGAAFDTRVVPSAVKKGGFYGREWKSSEMKKLVKKLPEIGNPFPIPSVAEFVPEPDKGPTKQEIAKEKREADAITDREKRKADDLAHDKELADYRAEKEKEVLAIQAENEKTRSEAMAEEMVKTEAMVAEQIASAKASTEDAMKVAGAATLAAAGGVAAVGGGSTHGLFRILLAVVLILSGLLLAGDKIPALATVVEKLKPMTKIIGLAAISIAILDFLLDLSILRPIIGDGLPQIIGLASGALLARGTVENMIKNEKVGGIINMLQENKTILGYAALALGVIHLVMGGSSFF